MLEVNVVIVSPKLRLHGVITSLLAQSKKPFQVVVVEDQVRLSAARNLGVARSCYDWVAFIDDDAEACVDWVKCVSESPFDVVGGPVYPSFGCAVPTWFDGVELGNYVSVWNRHGDIFGCNMAFRREVFGSVGGFNVNLGRDGKRLLGCEENDLLERVAAAGFKIGFSNGMVVYHTVMAERLRIPYFLKRGYWNGASQVIWKGFDLEYVARVAVKAVSKSLACYKARRIRGFAELMFVLGYLVYGVKRI